VHNRFARLARKPRSFEAVSEISAQFVHCSDQRGDVFGRRELRNAVAEIEHVAGPAPND